MRNNHVTWVQLSIKERNHLAPKILEMGASPHTLEWMRSKGSILLLKLREKDARWFFANLQTSQWNDSIDLFKNKDGNIDLIKVKEECPRRLC